MTVAQELARFREDAVYVDEHWEELVARYPERWIAVYERKVVADAKSPTQLRSKVLKKGIPPGDTYRKFLSTKEEDLLILPSA